MASVVVLVLTAVAFGALFGGYLMVSLAIRRDDRSLVGTLRFDAPNHSARAARTLVGRSSLRWDD